MNINYIFIRHIKIWIINLMKSLNYNGQYFYWFLCKKGDKTT